MKNMLLVFLAVIAFGCENNSFDSDKRQLIAKNEIRQKLTNIQSYDIKSFREDTLENWNGSALKNVLRYTLNIEYKDPTGSLQNREAFVIFTPDGKSVLSSQISN